MPKYTITHTPTEEDDECDVVEMEITVSINQSAVIAHIIQQLDHGPGVDVNDIINDLLFDGFVEAHERRKRHLERMSNEWGADRGPTTHHQA